MTTERKTLLVTPHFSVVEEDEYFKIEERAVENGVVIAAQRADGKFLIARLFRPAINAYSLEFPRGAIEAGETASQAAVREWTEETGYGCGEVAIIGKLHSNTTLIASNVAVALVKALDEQVADTDGEVESKRWVDSSELEAMIAQGEITDSHTLSTYALLKVTWRAHVQSAQALADQASGRHVVVQQTMDKFEVDERRVLSLLPDFTSAMEIGEMLSDAMQLKRGTRNF